MIVAIDGPAASGKTSTARAVARRLGFRHLESGGFYRALTLALLRAGLPPERWDQLTPSDLDRLGVQARPAGAAFRFFIGDEDVTDALRSPEVTSSVSLLARIPAVRAWVLDRLRQAARDGDVVADGRDMGTVVFPDADLKVYLTASPEARARRRLAEHGRRHPTREELEAATRELLARDRLDSERAVAPLRPAPDAVLLDTTALSFPEQVDQIVALALAREAGGRQEPGAEEPPRRADTRAIDPGATER